MQSLFRSFSSSSTKASSLELDLQFYASAPADHRKHAQLTSRFKRDKIPCLALPTRLSACSSMSTASASRSIEISIWQTGHSGCASARPLRRDAQPAHRLASRRLDVKVLPNALPVEQVLALRDDSIFGLVITQSANGSSRLILHQDRCLGSQDEIRVTSHLSHWR